MTQIPQNQPKKYKAIKIIAGATLALLVLFIVVAILTSLSSSSTSLSSNSVSIGKRAVSETAMSPQAMMMDGGADFAAIAPDMYYPAPDNYIDNLEQFETTDYRISGQLREFETFCDYLSELKADERFDFSSLSSSLNNCQATFFTKEEYANQALQNLGSFAGVQTTRTTQSVTRHREQIQSRTSIVQQQLQSVTETLIEAESAYNEIADFARAQRDTETYSHAITEKLRQVDQLTQRKISLTSQLDSLAQQSADLNQKIGVIEINVYVNRAHLLNPDKTARAWGDAKELLTDTWNQFGIWLTVYLGVFILFVLQWSVYLIILIVLARFGYKLARKIWRL